MRLIAGVKRKASNDPARLKVMKKFPESNAGQVAAAGCPVELADSETVLDGYSVYTFPSSQLLSQPLNSCPPSDALTSTSTLTQAEWRNIQAELEGVVLNDCGDEADGDSLNGESVAKN